MPCRILHDTSPRSHSQALERFAKSQAGERQTHLDLQITAAWLGTVTSLPGVLQPQRQGSFLVPGEALSTQPCSGEGAPFSPGCVSPVLSPSSHRGHPLRTPASSQVCSIHAKPEEGRACPFPARSRREPTRNVSTVVVVLTSRRLHQGGEMGLSCVESKHPAPS